MVFVYSSWLTCAIPSKFKEKINFFSRHTDRMLRVKLIYDTEIRTEEEALYRNYSRS